MDYKVKDIGLALQGRREIEIAEKDMPGLSSAKNTAKPNLSKAHASPAACT
ncbi:MAG: hypothetical protein EBR09_14955 [Proteobacteria bacterium]|nr:hypothetical protein [Pseudomonadota bacterium]